MSTSNCRVVGMLRYSSFIFSNTPFRVEFRRILVCAAPHLQTATPHLHFPGLLFRAVPTSHWKVPQIHIGVGWILMDRRSRVKCWSSVTEYSLNFTSGGMWCKTKHHRWTALEGGASGESRMGRSSTWNCGKWVLELFCYFCVSLHMEALNALQPVAQSFAITGKDIHVHHNRITAISKNKVRWHSSYPVLDSDLSGQAIPYNTWVIC